MSEPGRPVVKLALFTVPAVLAAAALHLWGSDIHALGRRIVRGGARTVESESFTLKVPDRLWERELKDWTEKTLADLVAKGNHLGFRAPQKRLTIVVVDAPITPDFDPEKNSIALPEKSTFKDARLQLSKALTKALLYHSGPPDAAWSHWLEEGLATFFETDDKVSGAKKEPLIRSAARREGLTLAGLLQGADPRESGFSAASHSLVAFLHTDFRADHIRRYVEEERRPGPVAPGTFERIFGADVERAWKDFLKQ